MPMLANSKVSSPPQISTSLPNISEPVALEGNSSVHNRKMEYSPTLVITVNRAATGGLAAE